MHRMSRCKNEEIDEGNRASAGHTPCPACKEFTCSFPFITSLLIPFFAFPETWDPLQPKGKTLLTDQALSSTCNLHVKFSPWVSRALIELGWFLWDSGSVALWCSDFISLGRLLVTIVCPLCIYRLVWVGFRASAVGLSLSVGGCGSVARVWSLWFN